MKTNSEGFRVCVKLMKLTESRSNEGKRFFIFINPEIHFKVKHVEKHLKKQFNIDNVELFINDISLPREETVDLIQPSDLLVAVTHSELEVQEHENIDTVNCLNKKKKAKKKSSGPKDSIKAFVDEAEHFEYLSIVNDVTTDGSFHKDELVDESMEIDLSRKIQIPDECYKELEIKRSQLLSKQSDMQKGCDNSEQNGDLLEISKTSDESLCKRKRKRVRKKKKEAQQNEKDLKEVPLPSFILPEPIYLKERIHIRFDDDIHVNEKGISDNTKNLVQNGDHAEREEKEHPNDKNKSDRKISNSVTKANNSDDWKENLLSLARVGKKSFAYKMNNNKDNVNMEAKNINGFKSDNDAKLNTVNSNAPLQKLDFLKNPIIQSVTDNDIIAFKKLKLDENYCPVLSNYIIGKVHNYNNETMNLTVEIIDGSNEFKVPNGKFSLDEEEEEEAAEVVLSHIQLNWSDLIEPRLVSP